MTTLLLHDNTAFFNDLTDAEEYIIGTLLMHEEEVPKILKKVKPEWFSDPLLRDTFEGALYLYEKQICITPTTICSRIKGGAGKARILNLGPAVTDTKSLDLMIEEVRKEGIKRSLLSTALKGIEGKETSGEMFQFLFEWVQTILPEDKENEIKSMGKISDEYFEVLVDKMMNDNYKGISSGIPGIDNILGGFHKGNLIVIGARPSMGKTAFAMTLFHHFINSGAIPLFVSLEMSITELMQRFIGVETGISSGKIRKNGLTPEEQKDILAVLEAIKAKKAYITDKIDSDITMFKTSLTNFRKTNPFDILIVDYLQLMTAQVGRGESRQTQISKISREMKNMARMLNIPVIALSQLSREVESRNPPMPKMSDLRESGTIEQDADVVMLMYRPKYYSLSDTDETLILVDKNRHGAVGKIDLMFYPKPMRFYEITDRRPQ